WMSAATAPSRNASQRADISADAPAMRYPRSQNFARRTLKKVGKCASVVLVLNRVLSRTPPDQSRMKIRLRPQLMRRRSISGSGLDEVACLDFVQGFYRIRIGLDPLQRH